MGWSDIEREIRDAVKQQPRGFQAELARKLEMKPATLAGIVGGARPVPREHVDAILDALGLELVIQTKQR